MSTKNPYATTAATHDPNKPPPAPVVPEEGSWMLLNTAAVSYAFGAVDVVRLYWTWKRQ